MLIGNDYKLCEKLPYCARNIDPCILAKIKKLQKMGLDTILSCCGHNKYPETIIIKNDDNTVYEYNSSKFLKDYNPFFDKRHNPYYIKDADNYYFIPGVNYTKNNIF